MLEKKLAYLGEKTSIFSEIKVVNSGGEKNHKFQRQNLNIR